MSQPLPPFSARSAGQHQQVESDFPSTAKTGLLHLLFDLVDQSYISNWGVIARELQRIGRYPPTEYELSTIEDNRRAKNDAAELLHKLNWEKTYDFCERLYSYLANEISYKDNYGNEYVDIPRERSQAYINSELQRLFLEESLAYEFSEGIIRRRGRKHTVDQLTKAQVVMGDPKLLGARTHFSKALKFFSHATKPDYENAVKEAVCAVEAAGKTLFPESKASTLGDLSKWLSRNKDISVPHGLIMTLNGVYAFRSGGNGVGHGGATGGVVTLESTEYALAVCASQIIYFVDIANLLVGPDVPF